MLKPSDFIALHPIFRFDEFLEAHTAGGRSPQTTAALLRYHVRTGRIRNLRRGLYATGSGSLDPWVLGSRLARDAVIAYGGALSFHRLSGLGYGIYFLTQERVARLVHNEVVYVPVAPPTWFQGRPLRQGIVRVEHAGQSLEVTTRERSLVDCLDRLDLAPDAESLWQCFAEAGPLDSEFMVNWVRTLGNRLAAARLGFFLSNLPGTSPPDLLALESLCPRSPGYFDRKERSPGDPYFSQWNLVVPRALVDRVEHGPRR